MLKAISVGRGEGVDVKIDDDTVSRLHVEIVPAGHNRYFITDCDSTSGTFIGREGKWEPIKHGYAEGGETVLLGNFQTTIAQLVELESIKESGVATKGTQKGSVVGRESTPQDQLPEGPVRRDPETGEIISIKD